MTDNELEALAKVVRYLWEDESKDYELGMAAGDLDHIFCSLEVLQSYLDTHRSKPRGGETFVEQFVEG